MNVAIANETNGAAKMVGDRRMWVNSQQMIHGAQNIFGADRIFADECTLFIRLAHDGSARDTGAGK